MQPIASVLRALLEFASSCAISYILINAMEGIKPGMETLEHLKSVTLFWRNLETLQTL